LARRRRARSRIASGSSAAWFTSAVSTCYTCGRSSQRGCSAWVLARRRSSGPPVRVTLSQITAAALLIQSHAPVGQQADLLGILQLLSERGYTARQLADAIPQGVVMGSSLFEMVKRLARAEGARRNARQICTRIARRHHSAIAERVRPARRVVAKRR